MSVDKFGRHKNKKSSKNFTTELVLDSDDNFNAHFRRIKNLKDPRESTDAATKSFIVNALNELRSLIEKVDKESKENFKKEIEEKFEEATAKIYDRIEIDEQRYENKFSDIQALAKFIESRVDGLENFAWGTVLHKGGRT